MKRTWFWLLLLILACAFSCGQEKKPKNEKPENPERGISLFNGKTLDGWKITQFGTQGPVQVTDEKIVLGMGDGLTGITFTGNFPRMNYEVSMEAMKMTGNDFFCGITFPVDSTFCSFIVGGWGGPVVGLSTIDGRDASENSTKTLQHFEKDVWYFIRLRVTPQKIEAWIDQKKVVNFQTEGHELYIRPEVALSRPFGIASWITTAALKDIRLKYLDNNNQSEAQMRASE